MEDTIRSHVLFIERFGLKSLPDQLNPDGQDTQWLRASHTRIHGNCDWRI